LIVKNLLRTGSKTKRRQPSRPRANIQFVGANEGNARVSLQKFAENTTWTTP